MLCASFCLWVFVGGGEPIAGDVVYVLIGPPGGIFLKQRQMSGELGVDVVAAL